MKKLIIQIPAYNEAETLPEVLDDLPRYLEGIESIQVIVIDDGSTDNTAQVALEHGADFVLRHRNNLGLSKSFISGIQLALALGADIIINTDADHQYPGKEIEHLIQPVLAGEADLVIGDRQPQHNRNFSPWKRFLEKLGSAIARKVSDTDTPDAVSGFRAYSRYAALPLQVYNPYSYTLETLVQAGKSRMKIAHVPIRTNPQQRESRLHRGSFDFIWRQSGVIIRSYVLYQPLRTFVSIGMLFLVLGLALLIRFLVLYFTINTAGRFLQSVSIGGTLTVAGIILIIIGFIGDSIRANRQISEELLVKMRNAAKITDPVNLTEFEGHPIYTRKHPFMPS